MTDKEVVVYISEGSSKCDQLLAELDQQNIFYTTKNVTKHKRYMKELQSKGVFGTPATFIDDEDSPILGLQKNKIIQALEQGGRDWNHSF